MIIFDVINDNSAYKYNHKINDLIDKDQFKVKTNNVTYKSDNIVFATGFYDRPFLIGVPGEDLSKVKHYYTEPHPYFGMDIVVVGSANSAEVNPPSLQESARAARYHPHHLDRSTSGSNTGEVGLHP